MSNSCLITITFQVPTETKGELLIIRNKLSATFSVKSDLPDPHITVYQCKIPAEYLQQVIMKVEELAKQYTSFKFNPAGLNIKNEYVGVGYQKTPEIEDFHKQVIEILNGFRNGLVRSTYIEKRGSYSPQEQNYIDQYGYPYVFECYKPHIALVALVDKIETSLIDLNMVSTKSFTSINIEIIIVSDDGKTIKTIAFG